jgi:hypothetical protein
MILDNTAMLDEMLLGPKIEDMQNVASGKASDSPPDQG